MSYFMLTDPMGFKLDKNTKMGTTKQLLLFETGS